MASAILIKIRTERYLPETLRRSTQLPHTFSQTRHGDLPLVAGFLPRFVHADRIVPARRNRNAVGTTILAPAEMDPVGAIRIRVGCHVIVAIYVAIVCLEKAIGFVERD